MKNKLSQPTENYDLEAYNFNLEDLFEWLIPQIYTLPRDTQRALYNMMHSLYDLKKKLVSAEDAIEKSCIELLMKQYPVFAKKHGISKARENCRLIWIGAALFHPSILNKIIKEDGCDENIKNTFFDIYSESPMAEELSPPILLNDTDRNNFPRLTNDQWKKKKSHHNQNARRYYNFHLKRMNEYMKVMRKSLSRYFPEINQLSTNQEKGLDFLLTNGYRIFRGTADRLQTVYDYNLDFRDRFKSSKEFSKIISKLDKKLKAEVMEIERLRLLGEKI